MLNVTSPASRLVALTMSAAVHVAAAAVVGSHRSGAANVALASSVIESPAPTLENLSESSAASPRPERSPSSARRTHTHPYPVPAQHDSTPHDPSLVHVLPSVTAVSPPMAATGVLTVPAAAAAPRFVMAFGSAVASHGEAEAHGSEGAGDGEIAAEDGVDSRPVLLSGNAPTYPPAAAAAGIELDVPVSILVGVDGTVIEARPGRQVGYGLEEAATQAVRGYRFSRGLRRGKPVRVRMMWTVMFRLK